MNNSYLYQSIVSYPKAMKIDIDRTLLDSLIGLNIISVETPLVFYIGSDHVFVLLFYHLMCAWWILAHIKILSKGAF